MGIRDDDFAVYRVADSYEDCFSLQPHASRWNPWTIRDLDVASPSRMPLGLVGGVIGKTIFHGGRFRILIGFLDRIILFLIQLLVVILGKRRFCLPRGMWVRRRPRQLPHSLVEN